MVVIVDVLRYHKKTMFDSTDDLTPDFCRYEREIRLRLAYGSNLRSQTNDGAVTLFLQAAKYGHMPLVELLLDGGIDVDSSDNSGKTALMSACEYKRIDAVRFLLSRAANVNVQSDKGKTALMLAVENENVEVVRVLLACGDIDVNSVTYSGDSALMFIPCFDADPETLEILKLLCECGCDVNIANRNGETPIMNILNHQVSLNKLECLLNHNADVNTANRYGQTPLMAAIFMRNAKVTKVTKVINLLLTSGANVNTCDLYGRTPLLKTIECWEGDDRRLIVDCLLNAGAAIKTEIHFAIVRGLSDVVRQLLTTKPAPCLQYISSHNHSYIPHHVPKLFKTTVLSPLFTAFVLGRTQLAKEMLDRTFVHMFDINPPREMVVQLTHYLRLNGNTTTAELVTDVYGTPWSLWTLAFASISEHVRCEDDKSRSLSTARLPKPLQKCLFFH